jgi:hypothetical protein
VNLIAHKSHREVAVNLSLRFHTQSQPAYKFFSGFGLVTEIMEHVKRGEKYCLYLSNKSYVTSWNKYFLQSLSLKVINECGTK